MTIRVYTGVQPTRVGAFTLAFTDGGGAHSCSVTANFCHVSIASVTATSGYSDFATLLQSAMNGVSSGYTVSFSTTTLAYTITRGTAFTIDGGTSAAMTAMLGTPNTGSSTTHTSTIRPYGVVAGTVGGRSRDSGVYEVDGIAYDGEADDGSSYSVARTAAPSYLEFSIPLEPKSAVYIRSAVASVPWTWQHLWEHARSVEPLLVVDSNTSESIVCKLRSDGASFKPEREVADYDDAWNIPFRTRVLGYL